MKYFKYPIIITLLISILSCGDEPIEPVKPEVLVNPVYPIRTVKTASQPTFDWENIDYMPTPANMPKIFVPWGSGPSIHSTYDPDVVIDRKAVDGWTLLYNTFNKNSATPLENPYFILYNKYRGLLRVYLYLTESFVTTSTYLKDGFTTRLANSSILNFMGNDIVDISKNRTFYTQIHPGSLSGSAPLATKKWYMMQYEIAYDHNIGAIPYDRLPLNWEANYCDVTNFKFTGSVKGTLKAPIASGKEKFFSTLGSLGKVVGTIALAGVGKNILTKGNTTNNALNLSPKIFEAASEGVEGAMKDSQKKLPGALVNFFSAVIGGSSGGSTISYYLDAKIEMDGVGSNTGALPSSPRSFWVPGTKNIANAVGTSPIYKSPLGVFNLISKPQCTVKCLRKFIYPNGQLQGVYSDFHFDKNLHTAQFVFNKAVTDIAKVEIIKTDFAVFFKQRMNTEGKIKSHDGKEEYIGSHGKVIINPTKVTTVGYPDIVTAVRYTLRVTPKDSNAAVSDIVKTFYTDQSIELKDVHLGGRPY
jgi:hypothetical protein